MRAFQQLRIVATCTKGNSITSQVCTHIPIYAEIFAVFIFCGQAIGQDFRP